MSLLLHGTDIEPVDDCAWDGSTPMLNGMAISRDRKIGTLGVVLDSAAGRLFATAFHTVRDPDDGGPLRLWCRTGTSKPTWEDAHPLRMRAYGDAGRKTDVTLVRVHGAQATNAVGAQALRSKMARPVAGDTLRFRGCRGNKWVCACEGDYSEAAFGAFFPAAALQHLDPSVMSVVRFGDDYVASSFPGDSGVSLWKTDASGLGVCVAQLVGVSSHGPYGLVVRLLDALPRLGLPEPVVVT
jgi:hypothetical protein